MHRVLLGCAHAIRNRMKWWRATPSSGAGPVRGRHRCPRTSGIGVGGGRAVLVTGTNGKTTTAHLVAAAVRSQSRVAHNGGGANMADGALAALLAEPSAPVAILEVDELHVAEIGAATRPELVVLLNLTRDQLDRSTEVAAVAAGIRAALQRLPAVRVLANGDDPVVTAAVAGLTDVRWFAGGCAWTQDSALCPRC